MKDDRSVGLWKVLFAGEIDKTCLGKYVENHMFNNVEICLMWSTLLVCTKTYYLEMYGSRNQSNLSCYSLSQSCSIYFKNLSNKQTTPRPCLHVKDAETCSAIVAAGFPREHPTWHR